MTRQFDPDDGTPMRRDRDGDLVPDHEALATLPKHPHHLPCADHWRESGLAAHNCRDCLAEIKAGDRPSYFLGRAYNVARTR